jgi:predicted alpha-1,6-mannanase (GH76 family)
MTMQPRTGRLGQIGRADDLLVPLGVVVGAGGGDGGLGGGGLFRYWKAYQEALSHGKAK